MSPSYLQQKKSPAWLGEGERAGDTPRSLAAKAQHRKLGETTLT